MWGWLLLVPQRSSSELDARTNLEEAPTRSNWQAGRLLSSSVFVLRGIGHAACFSTFRWSPSRSRCPPLSGNRPGRFMLRYIPSSFTSFIHTISGRDSFALARVSCYHLRTGLHHPFLGICQPRLRRLKFGHDPLLSKKKIRVLRCALRREIGMLGWAIFMEIIKEIGNFLVVKNNEIWVWYATKLLLINGEWFWWKRKNQGRDLDSWGDLRGGRTTLEGLLRILCCMLH